MQREEKGPVKFEDIQSDVQRKNADIAQISLQADEAMAPSLEAFRTYAENVLSVASNKVAESTNALSLCTRRAFEKADDRLTTRLFRLYSVFEGEGSFRE